MYTLRLFDIDTSQARKSLQFQKCFLYSTRVIRVYKHVSWRWCCCRRKSCKGPGKLTVKSWNVCQADSVGTMCIIRGVGKGGGG